jgi:FtsH-binding integral membrane protein|tara:strand:+ start:64 stop:777 length:714 start_codon:yes stop_codon:yes gene_type:complete
MKEQVYDLQSVASSSASDRASFIRKTYAHLAVAILGFIAVEYYLVNSPFAAKLASSMTSGMSWFVVLGLFMGVSYIANKLAVSQTSQQMQYLGLGLFVVAQAIVFLPLLYIATDFAGAGVIATAGLMTLLLVGGITATVFITKKDFSFMGSFLSMGGFVALGFILCSMIFGFSLGLVFSSIMVIFAGGAVLYSTSNVLHQHSTDQHVAAALSLFASIALMFFYILQVLMSRIGGGDN